MIYLGTKQSEGEKTENHFCSFEDLKNVIICGTVGAGKTTLIRKILDQIVNENVNFKIFATKPFEYTDYEVNKNVVVYNNSYKFAVELLCSLNEALTVDKVKEGNNQPKTYYIIDDYLDLNDCVDKMPDTIANLLKEGYKNNTYLIVSAQRADYYTKAMVNASNQVICMHVLSDSDSIKMLDSSEPYTDYKKNTQSGFIWLKTQQNPDEITKLYLRNANQIVVEECSKDSALRFQAMFAYECQDFENAIKFIKEMSKQSYDAEIYKILSECYELTDDLTNAAKVLETGMAAGFNELMVQLADLYLNYEEYFKTTKRGLDLLRAASDAGYNEANFKLGEYYDKKGNNKFAEDYLKYFISHCFTNQLPAAYRELGLVYERQCKYNKAKECYLNAIKLNDTLSATYLGNLYLRLDACNPNEAIKAFTIRGSQSTLQAVEVLLNPMFGKPQYEAVYDYLFNAASYDVEAFILLLLTALHLNKSKDEFKAIINEVTHREYAIENLAEFAYKNIDGLSDYMTVAETIDIKKLLQNEF